MEEEEVAVAQPRWSDFSPEDYEKTRLEYDRIGREETKSSVNGLFCSGSDGFQQSVLYEGRLGRLNRRNSFGEIIVRGFVVVLILLAASYVFQTEKLPQSVYDGLNHIHGETLPHLIGKASLFFSSPAAWVILFSVDIGLFVLYWKNEANIRLLQSSSVLRSLYHGFLLPIAIMIFFVVFFGGKLFLLDKTADIQEKYGIEMTDEERVGAVADSIKNGLALFANLPVVGDILTASTLVAVIPCLSLYPEGEFVIHETFCGIGAVFVFATVLSCFLDTVHLLFSRISLRNVLYVAALAVSCLCDLTVAEYYPQFTWGFVLVIVLHMIQFLECVFDIFSVSTSVRAAASLDKSRYPDYDEMQSFIPSLNEMAKALRGSKDVVVYVGDEVVRDGGFSLSSLGLFQYPFMWSIMPGAGMKKYKSLLRESGKTEGQKYVARLCRNLNALNGAHVTVVTECVDTNLELPPSASLIQLRGNIGVLKCKEGHVANVDPSDQLSEEDLVCNEDGLPLTPAIYLGKGVDDDALNTAVDAVNALHSVNGVVVVLGACENSVVRQNIIDKHKNDQVYLFQISSSGILPGVDAVVRASPRDVLFEIVDDLTD